MVTSQVCDLQAFVVAIQSKRITVYDRYMAVFKEYGTHREVRPLALLAAITHTTQEELVAVYRDCARPALHVKVTVQERCSLFRDRCRLSTILIYTSKHKQL